MVEVFKTNVTHEAQATLILECIHATIKHCKANFDLEDCDHILRVEYLEEMMDPEAILKVVYELGFVAEILPDEVPGPVDTVSGKITSLNESNFNLTIL